MEPVPREEFLRWAAGVGIGFSDSRFLQFVPPRHCSRFWLFPDDVAIWPSFSAHLLEGLDEWGSGFLWPDSGRWPEPVEPKSYDGGVQDIVLRGAGIPIAWPGAIRFERNEDSALIAVLFIYMVFSGRFWEDLLFIPDHGRQLLRTDHHDVVHVQCQSEERVLELVAHMANEGYELPTEPPDGTFKWPTWMGPEPI